MEGLVGASVEGTIERSDELSVDGVYTSNAGPTSTMKEKLIHLYNHIVYNVQLHYRL